MKRDMRRKENKQILGNASNRDAYEQQGSVILHDSKKSVEQPVQPKAKETEHHGNPNH